MSSQSTKKIIVEKRGTFNDDSFFKDSWSEWDHAMKDAVDRWEKQTGDNARVTSAPASETKTVYRQMRSSNVTSDESQAVSCTEEDEKYKMVMDVKDFSPEDISVKAVDDTVVVEGKIEKKEGNSVTTQKFVRRFLLPPGVNMNGIASALSKDGVLTINAPKLALPPSSKSEKSIPVLRGDNTITSRVMGNNYSCSGRPNFIQVTGGAPAGKPTYADNGPFNPTGGSNVTVYETSTPRGRMSETILVNVPDKRNHEIRTKTDNSSNWTTFNTMVENSQREMEDMMKSHTLKTSNQTAPSTEVISAPPGVATTRDVIRSGNTVTERQEKKWDDAPAPGMHRTNRALQENSEIKGSDGQVVGNKTKMEKESKAQGEREEVLPDGTKRKIFTKTYETKNSYTSNIR